MMSQFNFFDGAVIVILVLGLIGGFRHGLSGELVRTLSAGLALFLAWQFGGEVTQQLSSRWNVAERDASVLGFLAVLGATIFVLWGLGLLLRNLIDFTFKGQTERLGGGLLGLFRGFVIVIVALFVGYLIPNPDAQEWIYQKSYSGRLFEQHMRSYLDQLADKVQVRLPTPPAKLMKEAGKILQGDLPRPTLYDEPAR